MDTILAPLPADPATVVSLRLRRTGPAAAELALFELTTAFDGAAAALRSCSGPLALAAPDPAALASCPAGTELALNPQADVPVFARAHCSPCDPGYRCAGGVATPCGSAGFATVVGASRCEPCPTLAPANGTGGEGGGVEQHTLATTGGGCAGRSLCLSLWPQG